MDYDSSSVESQDDDDLLQDWPMSGTPDSDDYDSDQDGTSWPRPSGSGMVNGRPDIKTEDHFGRNWKAHDAWLSPTWKSNIFNTDITTEMIEVQSARHDQFQSRHGKIVLSPRGPGPGNLAVNGFRWLHVQTERNHVEILSVLMWCSDVGVAMRDEALQCLRNAEAPKKKARAAAEADAVAASSRPHCETASLVAAPYFGLEKEHHDISPDKTILEWLYGDRVGHRREKSQVMARVWGDASLNVLRVSRLWLLLLGSGAMVTCCASSAGDIRQGIVEIEDQTSPNQHTITVENRLEDEADGAGEKYVVVVDKSCAYVELIRRISLCSSVRLDERMHRLVCQGGETLTAEIWLRLLASGDFEGKTFSLQDTAQRYDTLMQSSRSGDIDDMVGKMRLRAREHQEAKVHHRRMQRVDIENEELFDIRMHEQGDEQRSDDEESISEDSAMSHTTSEYEGDDETDSDETAEGIGQIHNPERQLIVYEGPRVGSRPSDSRAPENLSTSHLPVELEAIVYENPDQAMVLYRPPAPDESRDWSPPRSPTIIDVAPRDRSRSRSPQETRVVRFGERVDHFPDGPQSDDYDSDASQVSYHRQRPQRGVRFVDAPHESHKPWSEERRGMIEGYETRLAKYTEYELTTDATLEEMRELRGFLAERAAEADSDEDAEHEHRLVRWLTEKISREWAVKQLARSSADRARQQITLLREDENLDMDMHDIWGKKKVPATAAEPNGVPDKLVPDWAHGLRSPFFTWKLPGTSVRNASDCPRVLGLIKRSFKAKGDGESDRPAHEAIYHKGFRCTQEALLWRHSRALGKNKERIQERQSQSDRMVVELITEAQKLLSAFAPSDIKTLAEPVCQRFWGAVDEQARQIKFYTESEMMTGRVVWMVQDPTENNDAKPPREVARDLVYHVRPCDACKNKTTYLDIRDALDHLHERHTRCPMAATHLGRPHEDPCLVWIHRPPGLELRFTRNTLTNITEIDQFTGSLAEINRKAKDIHRMVNTPTATVAESHTLPRSLVWAFKEVLVGLMCMSKRLSVSATERQSRVGHSTDYYSSLAESLQADAALSMRSASKYLDRARRDIIRSRPEARLASPGGREIGISFLAATLASHLQNRRVPMPQGPEMRVIEVYGRYLSQLRFQASRRPQRRILADLYTYEEELQALTYVNKGQRDTLLRLECIMARQAARLRRKNRRAEDGTGSVAPSRSNYDESWATPELQYLSDQLARLDLREDKLFKLSRSSEMLREHVKQRVEIQEEGHGRAIRVFTIVTLIFLPLSFITSFFGMNVIDIRDIGNDQSLYWIVSIPVTALTVALALLYGYRSDQIEDWFNSVILGRNVGIPAFDGSNAHSSRWRRDGGVGQELIGHGVRSDLYPTVYSQLGREGIDFTMMPWRWPGARGMVQESVLPK